MRKVFGRYTVVCGCVVRKVFSPEYDFRGNRGAGVAITDAVAPTTFLSFIYLRRTIKNSIQEILDDVSVIALDLQDVGVRCLHLSRYAP